MSDEDIDTKSLETPKYSKEGKFKESLDDNPMIKGMKTSCRESDFKKNLEEDIINSCQVSQIKSMVNSKDLLNSIHNILRQPLNPTNEGIEKSRIKRNENLLKEFKKSLTREKLTDEKPMSEMNRINSYDNFIDISNSKFNNSISDSVNSSRINPPYKSINSEMMSNSKLDFNTIYKISNINKNSTLPCKNAEYKRKDLNLNMKNLYTKKKKNKGCISLLRKIFLCGC